MSVPRTKELSATARHEADVRAARRVLRFAGEALAALSDQIDGGFKIGRAHV